MYLHLLYVCSGKHYGCIVKKKVMLLEELRRDTPEFGGFGMVVTAWVVCRVSMCALPFTVFLLIAFGSVITLLYVRYSLLSVSKCWLLLFLYIKKNTTKYFGSNGVCLRCLTSFYIELVTSYYASVFVFRLEVRGCLWKIWGVSQ